MNQTTPFRVRIKFAKQNNLRFIGHLDLQSLFERALIRTGLPLRYSQGFSPKVRLNIASALPLGFISSSEYLDFWLNEPVNLDEILSKFQDALPKDIYLITIDTVDNKAPSLQASVVSSEYLIKIPLNYAHDELLSGFINLISQNEMLIPRRNKTIDIKPMIEDYVFTETPDCTQMKLRMSSSPEKNGRPDELLNLLQIDPADVIIERTNLIFKD